MLSPLLWGPVVGLLTAFPAGDSPRAIRAEPSATDTRLLSQPAVSQGNIAFAYAGDLWVAGLDGSNPRRLTTARGAASDPAFSPDGRTIAFSGQYDGNMDVYVVPVAGGMPTRLTWHPGQDVVQGFTPDGKSVVFVSGREAYTGSRTRIYTVPVAGGFPEALEIPYANRAALSPDGRQIAYNPLPQAFGAWKNYRGGRVSQLWIFNRSTQAIEKIPQPKERSNDTDPMWVGDVIYFRSDRNGEFNLFTYDPRSKAVAQVTRHSDFPVIRATAGGGKIIYEQAGYLHLLDPSSKQSKKLTVGISTDLVATRPRFVKGNRFVREFDISPTGARAVFNTRGEIVTVPAEAGSPRIISGTTGTNERSPVWSPDGQRIAYFSDASGEYELRVKSQNGEGTEQAFKLPGAGLYYSPSWSPDGKKIAYIDISWTLYWLDLATGQSTKIATEPIVGNVRTLKGSWSPDSRWIAYSLISQAYMQDVHIYSIEQKKSYRVSDGLADATSPVFDKSGRYLYFLASTDAGLGRQWFMQSNADAAPTYQLAVAVLRTDAAAPWPVQSDEERTPTDSAIRVHSIADPVRIDFDRMADRVLSAPIPMGAYRNLQAGDAGKVYFLKTADGVTSLQRVSLGRRDAETIVPNVADYVVSADGKKLLYRSGQNWSIASLQGPVQAGQGRLAMDAIDLWIEPRAEWKQMYEEGWRHNRDLFYATNYHGSDWPAIRVKYRQFLDDLTTREDLTRVQTWMVSDLGTGHHSAGGGDPLDAPTRVAGGLLGADYQLVNGRYRFAKVYGGLPWNPDLKSPLTQPGVAAKVGEYLLAVNGKELRAPANPYSALESTADKVVRLTIGPNPDGTGSRSMNVVPIGDETSLRMRDWIEGNVRKVDSATGGRVAYVYAPNTGANGHQMFRRYFYPQSDRDAIIVDERFNGGGLVADYYIDMLRRPYISHWATRYGNDLKTPTASIQGPKVLIADEMAGSGGDLFPYMWRKFGLGPIVGQPTWGGLVGHWFSEGLLDGGRVASPDLGIWTMEEGFLIENVGVPPDVYVEQTPADLIKGRDPQLERAITMMEEALKKTPPTKYVRPPFPVRVGKNGAR